MPCEMSHGRDGAEGRSPTHWCRVAGAQAQMTCQFIGVQKVCDDANGNSSTSQRIGNQTITYYSNGQSATTQRLGNQSITNFSNGTSATSQQIPSPNGPPVCSTAAFADAMFQSALPRPPGSSVEHCASCGRIPTFPLLISPEASSVGFQPFGRPYLA